MSSPRVGQVLRLDFQADVYRGSYRLVERVGPNTWITEYLPPTEEEALDILTDPSKYARGQVELDERIARAGQRTTRRFVSAKQYARYF